MDLKWIKYAFKRCAIGLSPHLYWHLRRLAFGPLEPEMVLVPHLCSADAAMLDIGANWGAYSEAAVKYAKSVHCFEPQPRLARVLRRGLGRDKKVSVHQLAVSDTNGSSEIRIPRSDIGYSTLEARNHLESKVNMARGIEVVCVPTQRLDTMGLESVGFVKIDVEGHELSVLQGAIELIRRDHPSFVIEVEERHRLGGTRAVFSFLESLGYQGFILTFNKLERIGWNTAETSKCRNFIFVHEAVRDSLTSLHFVQRDNYNG